LKKRLQSLPKEELDKIRKPLIKKSSKINNYGEIDLKFNK
jgi:hypothetical protein